jgi:hypothetical protein
MYYWMRRYSNSCRIWKLCRKYSKKMSYRPRDGNMYSKIFIYFWQCFSIHHTFIFYYLFKQLWAHYGKHLEIIGIFQQELTGVESGINRKVFLPHWTAVILYLNCKITCSLNCKSNSFSGLSQYMCSRSRRRAAKADKRMVLVHTWFIYNLNRV